MHTGETAGIASMSYGSGLSILSEIEPGIFSYSANLEAKKTDFTSIQVMYLDKPSRCSQHKINVILLLT